MSDHSVERQCPFLPPLRMQPPRDMLVAAITARIEHMEDGIRRRALEALLATTRRTSDLPSP
jgi:hypothetical protein